MKTKTEYLDVTYEIEDEYVGGGRTQYVSIPHDEIQDCETVDEAVMIVRDYIEEDFGLKASTSYDLDKIKTEIQKILSNGRKE